MRSVYFTFRFPLAVPDIKVRFNFTTTIIYTPAGIIPAQNVCPDLEATVISGFPVFFQMILMIPEVPSGLNFAEGFVINSIRSMLSAGICSRIWAWLSADKPDALPLIQIVTLEFPRKDFALVVYLYRGNIFK